LICLAGTVFETELGKSRDPIVVAELISKRTFRVIIVQHPFGSDIDELRFALYKEIGAAMLYCFSSHLLRPPSTHVLLLPGSYSFAPISYEFAPASYEFVANSYLCASNSYRFVANSCLSVPNSFELKKVELLFRKLKRVCLRLDRVCRELTRVCLKLIFGSLGQI
jgi:hypothetical protein